MKPKFMVACAALVCCCYGIASAQNKDIPQQVKTAFAQAYPTVTKIKWEREAANYEGNFSYNGRKTSVIYTPDGKLMETETAITSDALPKAALQYARAKGKIKDAARIEKPDGTVQYEAEVNGKDLIFNDKGSFITENVEKD